MRKLLITILLIFLLIFIFRRKPLIEGLNLKTFNGRLSVDDQYFYDKVFDDVTYYPNEKNGLTGWYKCKEECPGNCIEYGITGHSYCFPY